MPRDIRIPSESLLLCSTCRSLPHEHLDAPGFLIRKPIAAVRVPSPTSFCTKSPHSHPRPPLAALWTVTEEILRTDLAGTPGSSRIRRHQATSLQPTGEKFGLPENSTTEKISYWECQSNQEYGVTVKKQASLWKQAGTEIVFRLRIRLFFRLYWILRPRTGLTCSRSGLLVRKELVAVALWNSQGVAPP